MDSFASTKQKILLVGVRKSSACPNFPNCQVLIRGSKFLSVSFLKEKCQMFKSKLLQRTILLAISLTHVSLTHANAAADSTITTNESCRELIVFTSSNQFHALKENHSRGSFISGLAGTAITEKNDRVILHKGCLLADTGSNPLCLATAVAGLRIPSQSTAMIEYIPGKRIRIELLSQGNLEPLIVGMPADAHCPVNELNCGETIELELISNKNIEAMSTANKFQVIRENTNSLESIKKIFPESVKGKCANLFPRLRKHIYSVNNKSDHKLKEKTLKIPTPVQSSSGRQMSLASLRASNSTMYTHSPFRSSFPVYVTTEVGSQILANENGSIAILSGTALIRTDSQQLIESELGTIQTQQGAITSIHTDANELRVHCFSQPNSVKLISNRVSIPLAWGHEATIINHVASWQDALPLDGIARRQFSAYRLSNADCVLSEFAIESLLISHEHLKNLRVAKNGNLKVLKERLIKTAAAVRVATASKGNYAMRKRTPSENSPAVANNS